MDTRNFTFMFYGFAAAWIIVALYVIWVGGRERHLRTELDRLKRMIGDGEGRAGR